MHMTHEAPAALARAIAAAFVILSAFFASVGVAAQWFNHPTPGVPRRADGTVNMTAPAPRLADARAFRPAGALEMRAWGIRPGLVELWYPLSSR